MTEGPTPIRQVSPDRAVITDDDREVCKACGERRAVYGLMYCPRCASGFDEDRLEREERTMIDWLYATLYRLVLRRWNDAK